MINMQGFSLLDIMSKSYKKGMNEMDSAGLNPQSQIISKFRKPVFMPYSGFLKH